MLAVLLRLFSKASPRNERRWGGTAVEVAAVLPVFIYVLLGTIEFCLMEGAQQMLESAAYNASRLAKTGYTASNSTQTETVSQLLNSELSTYGTLIDTARVSVTATNFGSFTNSGANTSGTSGYGTAQQIMVYTISYQWVLFTPMMCTMLGSACTIASIDGEQREIVTLTSTMVVRNEPYTSS